MEEFSNGNISTYQAICDSDRSKVNPVSWVHKWGPFAKTYGAVAVVGTVAVVVATQYSIKHFICKSYASLNCCIQNLLVSQVDMLTTSTDQI